MSSSIQRHREKVESYKRQMLESGKNLMPSDVLWLLDGQLLLLNECEAGEKLINALIKDNNRAKLDLVLRGDEIAQLSAQTHG